MTRASIAALLLASAFAALPLQAPTQAKDPRLVERLYDADTVVRVQGRVNVQSTIRFGDDETIENVAVGDSQSWQVTPNRRANLLFVKPLAPRAATNMTVVTSKNTYLFDLVASPNHRSPLYILTFTYPEEEVPEEDIIRAATPEEMPNAIELAAASDDLAVIDPALVNRQWAKVGVAGLYPSEVYDNGKATFLAWPRDANMPAILIKDADGTEGPVNFAVRGDVIVVDGVPREIVLRSGEDVAMLVNQGPLRPANAAGTGG